MNTLSTISYIIIALIGYENIAVGGASIAVCALLRSLSMLSAGCNVVIGPAIMADIYDYQQYKTSERLEGFMSTIGGYISAIGMIFTMLVSMLQEKIGFFPNQPEFIPGNALYNPEPIMPIFTKWMNTATWICAVSFLLSTIPLFFYNLTEKKHKEYMEIVKQRSETANAEEQE